MSLWKRGDWCWTDFAVNGTRYRLPLHTEDSREAKRPEKEKISDAQGGKLAPSSLNFARLGFTEAAERCLAELPSFSAGQISRAKSHAHALPSGDPLGNRRAQPD